MSFILAILWGAAVGLMTSIIFPGNAIALILGLAVSGLGGWFFSTLDM